MKPHQRVLSHASLPSFESGSYLVVLYFEKLSLMKPHQI